MTNTKEELMEKYKKLPKDLQDAIFSEETAEIIQKISEENKLSAEKIGVLADETGLLMLGITSPKNFVGHLAERLELDKELTRKIAHDVNKQIFAKVKESLKKIHGMEQPSQPVAPIIEPQPTKPEVKTDEVEPLPQAQHEVRPPVKEQEIFRSAPSETLVKEEKPEVVEKPETPSIKDAKYPGGPDPYREPID